MLRHLEILCNKSHPIGTMVHNLCALQPVATITTATSTTSSSSTIKQQPPHYKYCQISETNGVREICLNEPKTRNSLSLGMMEEILKALKQTWQDKNLRCIVITSTGPVWSSGHDLKELTPDKQPKQQGAVFEKLTEIIRNIRKAPVPVIARVDGIVAAGGVQLVASCDIIVCSEKSSFVTPSANFGVFASTPAVAMSRVMSHTMCLDMLMTGHPISAREAYIHGLVSRVVADQDLDNEMLKVIDAIKQKSRSVLAIGKDFFYKQLELNMQEAYKEGTKIMTDNLKLTDGREGVCSFVAKRKPVWSHL